MITDQEILDHSLTEVLSNFDEGALVLHPSLKVVYANPAFLKRTAYSFDRFLRIDAINLFPPEKEREVISLLEELPAKGELRMGIPIIDFYGNKIGFECKITAIPIYNGYYILFICREQGENNHYWTALEKSQKQLNLVLEGTNDGFWDWNLSTGRVEFSKRWAEMIGYTLEEVEQNVSFWEKIVHPEDQKFVFAEVGKHLDGETERYVTEHRIQHKDGSWIWILDRGKIVEKDINNYPIRMVGTHTDITEKKNAEAKIRYRELFEQLILEVAQVLINIPIAEIDEQIQNLLGKIGGFIGVDRSYIFIENPMGTEMNNTHEWCGPGIEKQIDKLQNIPIDFVPWWMEEIHRKQTVIIPVVDDLPEAAIAERLMLKEQDIKSVIAVPLINQNKAFGFVGFDAVKSYRNWDPNTDLLLKNAAITIVSALQRKENDIAISNYKNHLEFLIKERTKDLEASNKAVNFSLQKLARQNDELLKFKMIADKANYPLLLLSPFGAVIYSNSKVAEMVGSPEETLEYCKFITEYVDENGPNFREFSECMDQHINISSLEITILNRTGLKIPAIANSSAVKDKSENLLFFVMSLTDLTEQKKSEQRAMQSEKLRALGTLAGGIAHDFNNILQIVQVYSELIELQESSSDSTNENLQEIFKACQRGKSLISNILTFSRHEPNAMLISDFESLIREIVQIVRPIYPSSVEIQLNTEYVGKVACDPVQVQQIIFNLMNNAIDAMQGKGLISIDLKTVMPAETESHQCILLKISDTGKGMSKEILSQAFEPFFTTKGSGEGTGLGLSTVMGIVKKHNASIDIESAPGKGTTISICFKKTEEETLPAI